MTIREKGSLPLRPFVARGVDFLRRAPAEAGQLAGVRRAVLSFAEACGVTKVGADLDVVLAVGEACANVVLHAYVDAAAPGWADRRGVSPRR